MSKSLRLGVIGTGGRSALARFAHRPEEDVRIVAGADIHEDVLGRFRKIYGPDTFITNDYRQLLARPEIDAVFITSTDYLHAEHVVAALEAGKHVYLEKPMATSIEGADRILLAATRHRRKLYLGHNMRHMTFVLKMKQLIDQGAIGQPKTGWCRHFIAYGGDSYFRDWHCERSAMNSLLVHKASHDIDVLHWLCGGYTRRVTGMGGQTLYHQIPDRHPPGERCDRSPDPSHWPPLSLRGLNPIIDVEDLSMMMMQLDNGAFAAYQQCHYTPDAWRNYTIIGTEGRIENFGDEPGQCVVRLWNRRAGYNPDGDEQHVIPPANGSHGGADPRIVDEFIRYLRDEATPTTSPIGARYAIAAGCLAAHSLRNGSIPMEVPPVPPEAEAYFAGQVA